MIKTLVPGKLLKQRYIKRVRFGHHVAIIISAELINVKPRNHVKITVFHGHGEIETLRLTSLDHLYRCGFEIVS